MQKAMVRRWIALFLLVFFLSPTPAQAQWMMQRGIPQTPAAFDLPDVIRHLKVSDVPNAGANDSAKGFPSAAEENDSHLPDSAPISKDKEKQEEEKSSSEPEGSHDLILSVDIPASKDQEHLILHESYPSSLLKQWFGQESAVSVPKSYHLHSSDSALQKQWQYDFFDPAHQQAATLSQIQDSILTENPHPYEIQTKLPLSDLPPGDYTLQMQLNAPGEAPLEVRAFFSVPNIPSLSLREQEEQTAPDLQTLKDGIEIRIEQVTPDVLNHYLFTVSGKLRVREEILEEEVSPRIFYELKGPSGEPVDLVNILHPEIEEADAPAEVKKLCRLGNLNQLKKEADGSYFFESWLRYADHLQPGDYHLTLRVILPGQPVADSKTREHHGKSITFEGVDQNSYRYDPAGGDPLLHEQSLDFSLDEREVLRSQSFTKLATDAENFAVQSPLIEIGEEAPSRLALPVTMQTSFAKYFAPLYKTWIQVEYHGGYISWDTVQTFSFFEESSPGNNLWWMEEYYDSKTQTALVGYPQDQGRPVPFGPHLRLYADRYAEQEEQAKGRLLLDKPQLAPGEYEFIGKILLGELELHHSRLPLHIRAGEEEERALMQLRQQTELSSFEASFLPKDHSIHLSLQMNQKTREFLQSLFLSNEPHTQLGLLYTLRNAQGESVFETYGAHSICEKNRIPQEKRNPVPPQWEQKGETSLLRQTIGLPPLLPGGRYDLSVSLLWIRPGAQREIHTQTAALDIDSLPLPPGLDAQMLSKIRFIQEEDKEISLQLQKRERLSLPLEKEAYEAMQGLQQKGYSFRLSGSLQEEDGGDISDLSVRISDSALVQEEDRYFFRQEIEAERRAGSRPFPLHQAKKINLRLLLNADGKNIRIDHLLYSLRLTGKIQDEGFLKKLRERFILQDEYTERNYHYYQGNRLFKSRLSINELLYDALTSTGSEKLKLCYWIEDPKDQIIKSGILDLGNVKKSGSSYTLRNEISLPPIVEAGAYSYRVELLWEEDTPLKELQIPFFIHHSYPGDSDYKEVKQNADLRFTASNPKDSRILEIRGVASDVCSILYHQENIYLSIRGKIKDQEGRVIRSWASQNADSLENEIFLPSVSASFDRFGKGSFWMEIYEPGKEDCAFGQDLLLPSGIAEGPHTVELTLLYTNEASGVRDYPVRSFEAAFEASKQAADLPVQIHAELERPSAEGGKYSLQLRMKNPNSPPYLNYRQGLSSMQLSIYEDGQLIEQTDWTKELSSGREVRKNHSFSMDAVRKEIRAELRQRRFEGDEGYTLVKDFSLYPDPTLRIEEPGQERLSGKGEIRLILDSNPEDQDRFKLSLYRESESGVSHSLLTGSEEIPFTKISEEEPGKIRYQAVVPVDWDSIGNEKFKIIAVARSSDRKPPLTLRAVSDFKIIHKNSEIELSFAGENESSAVLLKKGQEQRRILRIQNKAPVAEDLTLKVQSPKDLSLELPEKIRLEGAGRPGDTAEIPLRLGSDQVQDETIEFIIKAAFDGKEYRKTLRFRVEELSDLTILPQSKPLMIPAGQPSEPYTLPIRNNNELPDAVKLQFLSEEVQVEAENRLSLPGKGSYSLPLRLTPKKDGIHSIKILATSENDPSKTYESSLSVHTRPLIKDQYMLSFPSSQILIGEKSRREVEFSIYNSSDLPIEDIRIVASSALLDLQIEPETIPYLEKRTSAKGKLKLQTHRDIEDDLQGEIEISISLHKAQPQIHKIPLRIVKARPRIKVNGGDALLRTSAHIGEEATAKLRIENAGNKEMKEIQLQPQSGLVPEKTHIAVIAPGESEIVTLRIPKEENTSLGEKTYPLRIRIAPGQAKEDSIDLTVHNTVVSSETGALELEVYELSGEKRRSGTIRLTHKEIPTQTREIPLSLSSAEEAVLVEDLMVGTYVMELLSEDKRQVKSAEIEIKPDLVYQKDLHIEVEDHLFDTRFTVEKIKIDEIYDVTLTTLWEESPPGLPSLSIYGTSAVLKPGEQGERSLIVKNTGSYPLTQINLHMLPRETEVNPSVYVSFSLAGKEKLDPGESYEIPVSCSASSGAKSGDYTSLALMAEAVCEDLPAFRRTDTRVFAKASASASVHVPGPPSGSSGRGYIHYPSSSGEGFRYRPFEGQGKELTKLILSTKIEMTREILDARLEMSGFKKDLQIKDLSIHILNSRQEEITEQFFQKIYEGEEFTSDALIQKGQEAKVGWYLADENLDIEKEESFFAYAKIHYEADGKKYTKTTEKASFTLKPRAFLQMDYHVPNYLREGRSYDIDILISNTGKGEAELTGITNSYLLQGEAKIRVHFDNISAGVIQKGEKRTLKARIQSDRDLKLVSSDLKVEYKNSLQLPLKPSIRTNFILKDTQADAAIDAFRRQKSPDPRSCINDPIDLSSGAQVIQKEILSLSGSLPMTYTLSYHSMLRDPGENGNGWSSIYEMKVVPAAKPPMKETEETPASSTESIVVHYSNTKRNLFVKQSEANGKISYTTPDPDRYKDRLTASEHGYTLEKQGGVRYHFDAQGKLSQIIYKEDARIDIRREGDTTTIADAQSDRFLRLHYDEEGRVSKVTDHSGREAKLTYDDKGNLLSVQDPMGRLTRYTYDEQGRIEKGYTPGGELQFANTYGEKDRIIAQTDEYGKKTRIRYEETEDQLISHVTDRNGEEVHYLHDKNSGRLLEIRDRIGLRVKNTYDKQGNLLSATNGEGETTSYQYDAGGNLLRVSAPQGESVQAAYDEKGNLLRLTDERGHESRFTYDEKGKLTAVQDPLGHGMQLRYGPGGQVLSLTLADGTSFHYQSENGKIISSKDDKNRGNTLSYDAMGLPVRIEDAKGSSLQMEYDASGHLKSLREKNGGLWKFSYDENGRLQQRENPLGGKRSFRWDLYGNLLEETDEAGERTVYAYDGESRLVQLTYPDGAQIRYAYDLRGNLLQIQNENGDTEERRYDKADRLLQKKSPQGRITSYAYDKNGRLQSILSPGGARLQFTYDESGNLLRLEDAQGVLAVHAYDAGGRKILSKDAAGKEIAYTYDEMGHLTKISEEGAEEQYRYEDRKRIERLSKAGDKQSYAYDDLGRLVRITNSRGGSYHLSYDEMGSLTRILDPLGCEERFTYDALQRKTAQIDKNGNQTSYTYDSRGDLITLQNALGESVHFTYDARRRLIGVTQGRKKIAYRYDPAGRLIEVLDALGNTTRYTYDKDGDLLQIEDDLGRLASYEYDEQARVIAERDALGNRTTYTYDSRGNLLQKTSPSGRVTAYTYDGQNRLTAVQGEEDLRAAYTYDAAGRLTGIRMGEQSRSLRYDRAGRLKESVLQLAEQSRSERYTYGAEDLLSEYQNGRGQKSRFTYDAAGRLIRKSDPEGTTTFTYDPAGNLLRVQGKQGEIKREYDALHRVIRYEDTHRRVIRYTYDEEGNCSRITYPALSRRESEKTVSYTYDPAGNLQTVTDWNGNTYRYTYDRRGRQRDLIRPDQSREKRIYDAKGQIIDLSDQDKDGNLLLRQQLSYDREGNILQKTTEGALQPPSVSEDEEIFLTHAHGMLYTADRQILRFDADGNILRFSAKDRPQDLRYDSQNRLIRGNKVRYAYDSEGTRIEQQGRRSKTTYVTDVLHANLLIAQDKKKQGTFYLYGNGLLAQEDPSGTAYYHYDAQGNTRLLRSEKGERLASFCYDPHGNLLSHTGQDTPFRYSGKYGVQTDESGLLYMRSRYYSPDLRQFLSADRYMGDLYHPASLNPYSYVEGNPVKYIDPMGYWATPFEKYQGHYSLEKDPERYLKILYNEAHYETDRSLHSLKYTQQDRKLLRQEFHQLLYEPHPYCIAGRDFMRGTADAIDNNAYGGAAQGLVSIQNPQVMVKPQTKAYYVGKLSADLMMFYHGLAAMAAGGAMMGGGAAASSTGAGALVGVPAVAEGSALAGYGMFVASNSMTNIRNDFEEAAQGIGDSDSSLDVSDWHEGSFDTSEESLLKHFKKHGEEVGARTPEEYLKKAREFQKKLKGARTVKNISGPTENVTRYYKNGKYIDIASDKRIISFGKQ